MTELARPVVDWLGDLRKRIEDRSAVLAVVGLGYVGLPVALSLAAAGYRVIGIDRQSERVRQLVMGENPIRGQEPGLQDLLERTLSSGHFTPASDFRQIIQAHVITINVDTPVDHKHQPNNDSLIDASRSIGEVIEAGRLVIVESTVAPGTTDRIVIPTLLKHSGLTLNHDLFVGACPERVMPGRLLENIKTVPRTCGGSSERVASVMKSLYESIVDADLDLTDILTAELVKVTENAYRDVQIGFANEIAMLCDELGVDVWMVRDLVNKVPFRDMHRPGGGVGGHCLPKDPWLLAAAAQRALRLIPTAREVNDLMPLHIADQLSARIRSRGMADLKRTPAKVALLGFSYLPESDDIRNTPSKVLRDELERRGFEVKVHDPFIPDYAGPVDAVLEGCEAVVVMVAHKAYDGITSDAPVVLRIGRRE